jgi:hypothetical protein
MIAVGVGLNGHPRARDNARMGSSRASNAAGVGFLLFFGLFWSFMTLLFDGFLAASLANQVRAMRFETTEGVIVETPPPTTQVVVELDPEATPDLELDDEPMSARAYTYTVGGRPYRSDRYRFASVDGEGEFNPLGRFTAGETVRVYYNPEDPGEAVLERGVQGGDLFMAMFMTPFNMVMLGVWYGLVVTLRTRGGGRPLRIDDDGMTMRVRPRRGAALAAAMITLGLASFISVFPLAMIFDAPNASSTSVVGASWILNVLLAAGVGAYVAQHVASGRGDLVLDRPRKTLTLPAGFQGEPVELTSRDIERVEVRTTTHYSSEGPSSETHHIFIHWHDRDGKNHESELKGLLSPSDLKDVEDTAKRLRKELGVRD